MSCAERQCEDCLRTGAGVAVEGNRLLRHGRALQQSHGGLTEEEPVQATDRVIQHHTISDSRRSTSS